MTHIHYSGVPGSGKTSLCLVESKEVLITDFRVFWLSGKEIDSIRFSQIMNSVPIHKAANFHLLEFGDHAAKMTFETGIKKIIIMCNQLKSIALIVIDGWDENMDKIEKKSRIDSMDELIKTIKKNNIKLIATSNAYENLNEKGGEYLIRAKNELEKIEFSNNLIIDELNGNYLITNESENRRYKITSIGIEYIND